MAEMGKIAILLTAHPKQQKWWDSVLLSLERYPGPLVLAYDDIDLAAIPFRILSRFEGMASTGHPAGELGHGPGELVCLREGFRAVTNLDVEIDYVLKLGFDEPLWRWRNIIRLAERLDSEGLDCIDCETRIIFGRPGPFLKAMEVSDVATRKGGSAEGYWTTSLGLLKLNRLRIDDREWWEKTLGLIHLQGEYAANVGQKNSWSWTIGELWPREVSK